MADLYQDTKRYIGALTLMRRVTNTNLVFSLTEHFPQENGLLTVRAPVDLIVVAPRKNVFLHNSPKVLVGHGLKDYGVKNLFTM